MSKLCLARWRDISSIPALMLMGAGAVRVAAEVETGGRMYRCCGCCGVIDAPCRQSLAL